MRNIAAIGIAAVAGFALAWLVLGHVVVPPTPSLSATPKPVAVPAPEVPAASTTVSVPPVATPTDQAPSIAAANPTPAAPATEEPAKAAPAAEEPADRDDAPTSATEDGDDAADSTDDDAPHSAFDVDRAADLLADWMAHQDAAAGDADVPPTTSALKTFDQESADSEWSAQTAQQIEATLDQWLAALPDDVREHIEVIHVECHETLCQILAADDDQASQTERAQSSQEWQQAIATLPQQPWWSEFGFVDLTNTVNNDEADGYVLYQTYLRREVTPPEG